MPLDDLAPTEVMALRFDEPATATELATWCGGEVAHLAHQPDVVVILVPGPDHARPAYVGDWITREPDGTHRVYRPEDFEARFEPTV